MDGRIDTFAEGKTRPTCHPLTQFYFQLVQIWVYLKGAKVSRPVLCLLIIIE